MVYKIVADTNLIISAVMSPVGKPARILDAVTDGRLILITSHALLKEIQRVFSYPKIQNWLKKHKVGTKEIEAYIEKLSQIAIMTSDEPGLDVIKDDPDDNIILAAALNGRADFIVYGDHHLTDLQEHLGIKILSPDAFFKEMEDQLYF